MNQILDTKLKKNVNQILTINTKKNVNQILSMNLNENNIISTSYFPNILSEPKKRNWFKFQFICSILVVITSVLSGRLYFYYLQKKENLSNDLIANYNIYRLYNSTSNNTNQEISNSLFRNN